MKICAQSPMQPEFSICGDAFDAPETETDVPPFRFAMEGETINCKSCKRFIYAIKLEYPRGYKYRQYLGNE